MNEEWRKEYIMLCVSDIDDIMISFTSDSRGNSEATISIVFIDLVDEVRSIEPFSSFTSVPV